MSETYFGIHSENSNPEAKIKKDYVFTSLPRNIALFVRPVELAVLHVIADYVFAFGRCLLSNTQIAELLAMGRGKVNAIKKSLVAKGIIFEKSQGMKKANIATLNESRLKEIADAGLLKPGMIPNEHDPNRIMTRSQTDHDHDPRSISIKEEERIYKELRSSVSRETGKFKTEEQEKPLRLVRTERQAEEASKPPTEHREDRSVSFSAKENACGRMPGKRESPYTRGTITELRGMAAAFFQNSNFNMDAIRGSVNFALRKYPPEMFYAVEAMLIRDETYGRLTWNSSVFMKMFQVVEEQRQAMLETIDMSSYNVSSL